MIFTESLCLVQHCYVPFFCSGSPFPDSSSWFSISCQWCNVLKYSLIVLDQNGSRCLSYDSTQSSSSSVKLGGNMPVFYLYFCFYSEKIVFWSWRLFHVLMLSILKSQLHAITNVQWVLADERCKWHLISYTVGLNLTSLLFGYSMVKIIQCNMNLWVGL